MYKLGILITLIDLGVRVGRNDTHKKGKEPSMTQFKGCLIS